MDLREGEFGFARCGSATGAVGEFFHAGGHFPIEIPAWPGKLLTIWELHAIAEVTLFLKVSSLRTKSLRVGKNLCANVAS
jgi:hypothetical protein